ncbi:putative phosphoesterase, ICC [Candidatus Methanoperedens nitroreducens]|uniref:Putative phosphoesterase, ICC n=1 Tax=Candidatus Methanoperedens nitratireducens TaxID=1392998 RepID=A0A062V5R6_9EURY|nr:metallophosphoesterase [Candidatus Methanoperedens nitroreducens]KCZ71154.1 putative phosphoesterase, ICC [Candidatus Methanoperedens nitroreducens]MDJ1421468.1 metallophosphoesterase [Candidatus Methanoperedens sp.]
MKLLALSDLHGDYSHVQALCKKAGDFDAVLIAGDITDFGPDERALELLKMFKEPVLAVPGNCDNPSILKLLDENAINLHNSRYTMAGLTFVGLGGSNPTPFNTPFELSEKRIGEYIGTLLANLSGRVILLSHAPPRNTTDRVPGGNVGSEALARFLRRFDLIVCGHIHEARGSVRVNGTLVVNPGMASKGQAAMITINDEIKVEFIDE